MTEFKQYDQLTWPEVKSLPRYTPMVLPLGSGYSLDQIADALNNPTVAYLLPPFPYGWQGSGLVVSDSILESYLTNIISSLKDDGFLNTLLVLPQGLNLNLSLPWIALPSTNDVSTTPALPPDSEKGKLILMPIGHTEQHGYHLPLSTDTLIIDAIAQGTAVLSSSQAITCNAIWC